MIVNPLIKDVPLKNFKDMCANGSWSNVVIVLRVHSSCDLMYIHICIMKLLFSFLVDLLFSFYVNKHKVYLLNYKEMK